MTFEDFLKRAYGVAMTPLPGPSVVPDVGPLAEVLRGIRMPSMPELPVMPEAWRRYAIERGLMPAQSEPQAERNMLINNDPAQGYGAGIPNVYRGMLQPSFESGNSLPAVYDRTAPVRI